MVVKILSLRLKKTYINSEASRQTESIEGICFKRSKRRQSLSSFYRLKLIYLLQLFFHQSKLKIGLWL
ncbi:hypothetical protein PHSC3_001994 [Chlamydiales bacterium STE3]|nr:hypothetical protein PHSC3_001994 [Chlamydiales bacterium STE3]